MDQNGLCVIKKIIIKISNPVKMNEIAKVLTENAIKLV